MKNNFFNYIFYRLTQFYYKWDGRNGITAILGISMIQCLLLFDLFLTLERILYSKKEIFDKGDAQTIGYIAVISFLIFAVYNLKKYHDKFIFYKNIWKNESLQERRKKGFLVILCLVTPWLPLILLGLR